MPRRNRTRRPLAAVRAAALAALAALALLAGAPADPAPVPAAQPAGPAVAGRVVRDGGELLAGATVALLPVETDHARLLRLLRGGAEPDPAAVAKTGADGRFRLDAPAAGMWVLAVEAPGRASAEHDLLPLLADEELGDLELPPAGEVRVEVRDAAGRPVAGALVEGREAGGPWRRTGLTLRPAARRARTGADGRAVLPRAEGGILNLVAVGPGLAPTEQVEAAGAAAAIALPGGRSRAVRVQAAGGAPVEGAVLFAASTRIYLPLGVTGADGAAVVHQPAGAKLALAAYAPDGRVALATLPPAAPEAAAARPPEPAPPFVVELPALSTVSGRTLAGPGREPVAGAWVWPTRDPARHARSDARGGFSLAVGREEAAIGAAAAGHGSAFTTADRDGAAVTLLLPVRARLAGRVVDEEDRPVADAEVRAGAERGWRRPWRTRSGPEGRFELEVAAIDGAYLLRAEHAGWAPAEATTTSPAAGEAKAGLKLVLRRGRTARGRVVDETEEPVAGARVALSRVPEGMDLWRMSRAGAEPAGPETTTDAEGGFVVRDLGGGRYDLAVEAPGFAPAAVPGVEVPAGAGETDLGTVILAPGRRVTGRVVDPAGAPIEGARISVSRDRLRGLGASVRSAEPEATSAADGWFEVVDLAAGQPVDLLVARSGYATETVPGVTPPTAEPLRVVLRPTVTVRGTVVGSRGEPVEGAELRARTVSPSRGASGAGRAESDERGEFELEGVEPGEVVLTADAEGYQRREVAGLTVAPGRDHEGVRVELEPGATVAGTVTGADGEPAAGAWVRVEGQRDWLGPGPRLGARADAEGRYELDGVPPGRRTISAGHDDHLRAVRDLEVTLGENRLDFRLERGLEVRGRVLDAAGAPVPGARVSLVTDARMWTSRAVAAGDDGSFALTGVEPGTYQARAEKAGYAAALSEPITVSAPVDGLELRLERGAAIVGTVVGADPDDLAGLTVFAQRQDGGGHGSAMAPVDFEGRFRLEGILPGEWMLIATAGMGRRMATTRVEVEPGAVEVPVTIELGGGLTLEGEVLSRGEPLAGMMVAAMGAGRASGGMATSDHRGAFRIEGLEPGDYVVEVFRPGSALRHREELRIDGDRVLTIEIDPAAIRGRVVDTEDGTPVGGARLRVEKADDDPMELGRLLGIEAASAPDGAFRIADLSPGSYVLVVTAEGYRTARRPVELAPGAEVAGVEIELQRSTAEVELEVRAAAGAAPPDAVAVVVLPPPGGAGPARPVASGRFPVGAGGRVRVPGLAAGTWQVLVGALGLAAVKIQVTLPGPPTVVTLPRSASLSVRVPELSEAGQLGEVRLRDVAGEPFVYLDFLGRLHESFPLTLGRTQVRDLPPGTWIVEATTPDGRTWTGQATLAAGSEETLILE